MQVSNGMVVAALDAFNKKSGDYAGASSQAMLAALEAALAAMWQDISTAPKDERILVAAHIIPSEEAHRNGSRALWDIAIGRAYGTNLDRWSGVLGTRPSDWMPLPQPPRHKEG